MLQQHRLGHFELEPAAGKPESASARLTFHHVAARICTGERLTASRTSRRPARRVLAGAAQCPLAERDDQPGVLGQRNELPGDTSSPSGCASAAAPRRRPRFRLDGNHRLIAQLELFPLDRLAQRHRHVSRSLAACSMSLSNRRQRCGRRPWCDRARDRPSSAVRARRGRARAPPRCRCWFRW